MKVLFVYPYLPYPDVPHGSGRLIVPLLSAWRDRAEITLVCGFRPQEERHLEAARSLVHDLVAVPRPLRADMSPAGRAIETARTAILTLTRRDPIHATKLDRAVFREAIRAARARTRFDVAHVEGAGMARSVSELDGLPRVLVDHEAGSASGGDIASDPRSLRYIQAIYPRFSTVVVLSREDAEDLRAVLPRVNIVVRRPGAPPPSAPRPSSSGTPTVLFFGSPDHRPNLDAMQWLASEIWPRVVAEAPRTRCVVAGGSLPPKLSARLGAAGIEDAGFVDDIADVIARASAIVAPIRLGRGVRIKNIEALAAGRPLVTTTLGARGLDLVDGVHALIADDAASFATATARIVRDRALAASLGAAGAAHVARTFTHKAAASLNLQLWNEARTQ